LIYFYKRDFVELTENVEHMGDGLPQDNVWKSSQQR